MGNRIEGATVQISWNFKPKNYFEDEFQAEFEGHTLSIKDGIASVTMAAAEYDEDPGIRARIDQYLNSLFEGVRLQSFEDFELSKKGSITRTEVDGKTTQYLSGSVKMEGKMTARVDALRYNEHGEIVQDTRADRIAQKQEVARLVAKWKGHSPLCDAILQSWENAIKYPENEFVYLYEIRDALSTEFGGEQAVQDNLKISKSKYKDLGRLTSHEPVLQGRHRGKNLTELRDATPEELATARSIAQEMFTRYLGYLEKKQQL